MPLLALYEISTEQTGRAVAALRPRATLGDAISPDGLDPLFTPIVDRIEAR